MGFEVYYKFILTFALILVAAAAGGELARRYLKQPQVLGELIAGMIISPFALGSLINDPIIMNFAIIEGAYGLGEFSPLEVISQISVVILLFTAGVETDVRTFIKNIVPGSAVALGGVILPFALGFLATMYLGNEYGFAGWLFMGAALTATSIGVTVRLFLEMGRLQTKPGIIIVVAAVIDDIIGIIVLSVVLSVVRTGSLGLANTFIILVISMGGWFACLMVATRWSGYISRYFLAIFRRSGMLPIVALLIGFLVSYLATLIGLHPVVGAYLAGLIFSSTMEKDEILQAARPLMLFLGPFFFAYLGMQVDIFSLRGALGLGGLLLLAAVVGKLVGCYIPARLVGKLRHRGGMIVGIGMIPRGEVGLIVAGVGLIAGAIDRDLFAIAVFVSIMTTLVTPLIFNAFIRRRRSVV